MVPQFAVRTLDRAQRDLQPHFRRDFESCASRAEVRQRIGQGNPHLPSFLAYRLFKGRRQPCSDTYAPHAYLLVRAFGSRRTSLVPQFAVRTLDRAQRNLCLYIRRDFESCASRAEVRQRIGQGNPHLPSFLAYRLFKGRRQQHGGARAPRASPREVLRTERTHHVTYPDVLQT